MQPGDEERRRILLLAALGFVVMGRGAVGAEAVPTGFQALCSPVRLPLESLLDDWQTRPFEAVCRVAGTGPKTRLPGLLIKLPDETTSRCGYAVFCLLCPHEVCRVDWLTDPQRFRRHYTGPVDRPMFLCPCHFSVFDPAADGQRLAGPAARGLYRFAVSVSRSEATVTAVETAAFAW